MKKEGGIEKRNLKHEHIKAELVIVGGGLSGTCSAITAARQGVKVALIQDRPVLGGNSSSEVRLWVLGATSHMGNNNRWAREGGVIDEILVENMYRNKEGNAIIFDTVLLEKVIEEPNIQLFLNTAVYEAEKKNAETIKSVSAFCSQNSTHYTFEATLFCDASGDGIAGFLAGAAFRMGAESSEEFGEKFAPSKEYGELLGHTIYFYSKDTGHPVKFVAPSYALKNVEDTIPRYRNFKAKEFGCRLWWIEYGGRMDTVHETEKIKWELWKVVYGVWDYIKNSGKFSDAENLTLEWVGTIPGKRESRRFEGDYMIRQQDIIEQTEFTDAVAFGGWSIDLHPADGVFSEKSGCNQWHSKGVYQIPYRTLYSKNISNLFLAGRIMSATHVAFGSTRVMATAAHVGQAIGVAAKIALDKKCLPKQLVQPKLMKVLQQTLLKTGQHIPQVKRLVNPVFDANISVSSTLQLQSLEPDGKWETLEFSAAQMLPAQPGKFPAISFCYNAFEDTTLEVEFRISSKYFNHSPDVTLEKQSIHLKKGGGKFMVDFNTKLSNEQYVFICLMKNDKIKIRRSETRITGILSVFNRFNKAVSNYGKQEPAEDIGVEAFEFWTPMRRPEGQNLAFELSQPLKAFESINLKSGYQRPVSSANAWVAALDDQKPTLKIAWEKAQTIQTITLHLDSDFDHPAESSLMGHPEDIMPFVVRNYAIKDEKGNLLATVRDNHQTINQVKLEKAITTKSIIIEFEKALSRVPVAVFEIDID